MLKKKKKKTPRSPPPLLFVSGQEVTVCCRGDLPWPPTCRRCRAEVTCFFGVSSPCMVTRFSPSVLAVGQLICHVQSERLLRGSSAIWRHLNSRRIGSYDGILWVGWGVYMVSNDANNLDGVALFRREFVVLAAPELF